MKVTADIFNQFVPGEVMKIAITRIQNVHEPMKTTLKFVAVKGDGNDWTIYFHSPETPTHYILTNGDKVTGKETIQFIFPCEDEVFKMYRY